MDRIERGPITPYTNNPAGERSYTRHSQMAVVLEELKRRRWSEADLGAPAKGDAGKVAIAVRLRTETVMPVRWIAERLQMGAPGYVNHLLYRQRRYAKIKN